ncbi:UbiA family prenyltransferase [Mangrovibrevibacter kandeliae]|uniref:UbiA family prenyltransferase n=1 Tax=Mangrovibrevibacter kandeliae TaxID=2968473 RepID=UPI0021180697|nr:UbiA family prenyltransferase [Aurantimonas sp. CSK15Z-1]MCQ8781287.1 UbiA family prenyltransferase [Aurantimonas sp. CSK15Z-1]
MDVRVVRTDQPIYVDLDGTLIRTDLLWESVFLLARQNPLSLWRLPLWAMKGKAVLKAELARCIEFDASLLPYRQEVVEELRRARADGRRIVLATGANEVLAHAVAEHLDLFDAVMASDDAVNLTAERKLERIASIEHPDGFGYYGNSHDDVCLLDAAAAPVVVAPDRQVAQWQRGSGAPVIARDGGGLRPYLKAMRPHQWMKNLLIFVPLVMAHEFLNLPMVLDGLLAFVSFSAAASSVYLVNDLLDLTADRRHKTKRNRPFASGAVPIPGGLALAAGLLCSSFAIAALLPVAFLAMLCSYLVMTTAYSVFIKRMLLIDVIVLAALYTVRIIAGAMAADVEVSFWLLAFSIFFFLSLALVKRFTELQDFGGGAHRSKTGRGYVDVDLETIGQAGMASGFAAVTVLALYVDSSEVRHLYGEPRMMWLLCPLVLYIIVRIWILARRDQMHDDPVVFILRDWRSQIMIALGALMLLVSAYV